MKHEIQFTLNGDAVTVSVDPWQSLNTLLRETLNLTGTKLGCGTGDCGACTVLLDGKTVSSCLTLAVEVDGREVKTIEGLAPDGRRLHPIQESFIEHGAIQCGYCTAGMELSALHLLERNPAPTEREIREGISGNLCRCTGYTKIVEAIAAAAPKMPREGGSKGGS